MALTYGAPSRYNVGGRWETVTTVTLDNSYPTGGYTLNGYSLGLPAGTIDVAEVEGASAGYVATVNPSTGKVQMYNPVTAHTHTENTAGSYTQNATTAAATAGVATEVVATTDLSAVTVTVAVRGR